MAEGAEVEAERSSRSRKWRTPLDEVKTSQSNSASRPIARSTGRNRRAGGSSTVGAVRTSAPRASRIEAERSDSSAGRVTTIRRPNSGSSSNQSRPDRWRDHVADDEEGRRAEPGLGDAVRAGRRACRRRSAGGRGCPTGSARRGSSAASPADQGPAEVPEPGDAHVDDQGAGEPGEGGPVEPANSASSGSSWPVTKATAEAASRWVTGIPA